MRKKEIEAYLSHLAIHSHVSASTQRQAMNSILFFYRDVLNITIEDTIHPVRYKRDPSLPVVMSQSEVKQVLAHLQGQHMLMARLLYGSGLRLMECTRLRVKDIDPERKLLYVKALKDGKDRTTLLPKSISNDLQHQLECAK